MKITAREIPPAPRRWPLFCLAILAVAYLLSVIVPPFQAPDEFDHVKRAYMFSHGQILLKSKNGSPSGGKVDTGLLEYMDRFVPLKGNANRKLSSDESVQASGIHWAHKSSFETPVGTAYYFPVMYAPQALGLALGKATGLTVDHSYRLARFLALAACLGMLFLAFRLYPPPTLVLAILALPMNLFLLSSAALDGLATCTAVLALSSFMRLIEQGRLSRTLLYTLTISIALVAACRANMLPLLLLPFVAWWNVRDRRLLIAASVVTVFVLAWTLFTIKFTVYPPGPRNIDQAGKLLSYLLHPWEFLRIVYATLTNASIVSFYAVSFIGVLGWLDAPFTTPIYYALGSLLIGVFVFSFSLRPLSAHGWIRGLMAVCAVGAVLLTFLALLVQWTVGPATTVDGVQGRYFMIPAMTLVYALFGEAHPISGVMERLRAILATALLALAAYCSTLLLSTRYYMQQAQPEPTLAPVLQPSAPLTEDRPIAIHFNPEQASDPVPLNRIDLRFGTYMTSHPGKAALRLWTNGGEATVLPFELSELVDNAYRKFELDGKRYVRGEIISQGGQGVSLYEVRLGDTVMECMVTYAGGDRVTLTPGCPQP
jgi:uncharacterized membrane protein